MKISGDISKITGMYDLQKNVSKVEKKNSVSKSSDVLSLSNEAKDYKAVMKAVKEASDIRTDKVDELRKKLADGSYKPEGRSIVDKLTTSILDKKI